MLDLGVLLQDTFSDVEQIGAGGGGTVFKAYHKRLEKTVVLKKIHTNQVRKSTNRTELDILKGLKSDYLPVIYDFIDCGNEVFTVMEYIPGKSFEQLLEENKESKKHFAQKDVVKWTKQLCDVVAYLHKQNPPIIHCDIKPANVMLTPSGDICLIDFNISGTKSEESQAAIGYSHGYAPVEQFAVVATRREMALLKQNLSVTPSVSADMEKTEVDISDKTEVDISDETEVDIAEKTEVDISDKTEVDLPTSSVGVQSAVKNNVVTADIGNLKKSLLKSIPDSEWELAKKVQLAGGDSLKIDERTDIYSLGATLYHILTGQAPEPFYKKQSPIRDISDAYGESIAYIIEKAMQVYPKDRFKTSKDLKRLVDNIGVLDKRYKSLVRKQFVSAVVCMVLFAASVLSVVFGKSTMAREKEELYEYYVESMQSAREKMDFDAVQSNYFAAVDLFDSKQDAYFEMGMALYQFEEYEAGISYVKEEVFSNGELTVDEDYSRFYFVYASYLFELEQYSDAVKYYKKAIELCNAEVSYYRDYVISLAYDGKIDEAEIALSEAEKLGLSSENLSLLYGEISLIKEKYAEAEKYLLECINVTADSYLKLRAYTKLDDTYKAMYSDSECYNQRVTLLTGAIDNLPVEYQTILIERLAQVYIDYSDVENKKENCLLAISLFDKMEDMGYATYTSRMNIAILYHKIGDFSKAMEQLNRLLTIYPDNYNVYKRMAYVELDIQARTEKRDRDYHTFKEYYDRSMELYKENAKNEDMEMLSLQQLYEDVVFNGWL